jgi:hypothetical protein
VELHLCARLHDLTMKSALHQAYAGANMTQEGLPVSTTRPVGVGLPVTESIRKATMLWLCKLAE